jgi:flagellum-specific peptidoglycan hydrolase FlgJ
MINIPKEITDDAIASHATYYPRGPFASVSLAQFGDESNWGKVLSGDFNPFGIKATQAQIKAGKYRLRPTREQRPNGQYVRINAPFASYASWKDAFDAHAELLCTSHYARCQMARTPEEYCLALHLCGYATEIDYAEILIKIINSGDLKKYDVYASRKE